MKLMITLPLIVFFFIGIGMFMTGYLDDDKEIMLNGVTFMYCVIQISIILYYLM